MTYDQCKTTEPDPFKHDDPPIQDTAMDEAIERFVSKAHSAVSHVGLANYREREADAHRWIREAAEELKAMLTPR